MHSIFQMSAYDITTHVYCLGNIFFPFLENYNKLSNQDCFLLMHDVNDSWLSGLPREYGEKTILVKVDGKRGHSPNIWYGNRLGN